MFCECACVNGISSYISVAVKAWNKYKSKSDLCKQSPPTPVPEEDVFTDIALNNSHTNPDIKYKIRLRQENDSHDNNTYEVTVVIDTYEFDLNSSGTVLH